MKLQRIQKELQTLDDMVSNDISILRGKIEEASWDYSAARKRYEKAEAEFVVAKLELHKKTEQKEQLTEHLCAIIQQNELRKAQKLEQLMAQLELHTDEMNQENNQGSNQESNQGSNQEMNQENNQGSNQGSNQEMNQESNQGSREETNEETRERKETKEENNDTIQGEKEENQLNQSGPLIERETKAKDGENVEIVDGSERS